jgi:hypothetical protein
LRLLDQTRILVRAGAQPSILRLDVQLDESKAEVPSFVPLKVVSQRPVKVAADIVAVKDEIVVKPLAVRQKGGFAAPLSV